LIKKGKTQKYIKDDKEFTREILRRATENLAVEIDSAAPVPTRLEGSELRAFLISLDEFQQIFRRMERRVRDARVVEALANINFKLDTKADFQEKSNLEPVVAALTAAKVTARIEREEEHEAWKVMYQDPMNAERGITIDLALQPEFRRMRTIARQVSKFNRPPFKIVKEGKAEAETKTGWRDLLEQVKSEGMREVSIQRYKGLGEMNAEQLWATTMNAETRTLLKVDLHDLAETETIFSTLMGEDVESRRKFIEENALDVRNLDV